MNSFATRNRPEGFFGERSPEPRRPRDWSKWKPVRKLWGSALGVAAVAGVAWAIGLPVEEWAYIALQLALAYLIPDPQVKTDA